MEHKKFGELTADEQKELLYARYVLCKKVERLINGFENEERWKAYSGKLWRPDTTYRITPTLPSINWSHVHEKYKWLAINPFGEGVLFTSRPEISGALTSKMSGVNWSTTSSTTMAGNFASYKPGDCHWTESLIERPKAA